MPKGSRHPVRHCSQVLGAVVSLAGCRPAATKRCTRRSEFLFRDHSLLRSYCIEQLPALLPRGEKAFDLLLV